MRSQASAPRNGIAVASGYGIKVYVERGHLVLHDGIADKRQTCVYNRATSKLQRLVVIGRAGYVSLEALQWLRDIGAALVHIDANGLLVAQSSAVGPDLPTLRRAQALAAGSRVGLAIARSVLAQKLAGQAALLSELPGGERSRPNVEMAIADLHSAATIGALLAAEAQAAAAYWDAWATVEVRLGTINHARIPGHWHTFGQRHSPLSRRPRHAANPANAILNYLYTLLEAETVLACQTIGLDPGIGIFHVDRNARASFALDLMEAIRPNVDAYLLALVSQRTLSGCDFAETRRGVCRILPTFAKTLTETTTTWERHVAPVVEGAARTLATKAELPGEFPTTLTQQARIAAWDGRRRKPSARRSAVAALPATCRDCGVPLLNRRQRYCPNCRRLRFARAADTGRAIAAAVLAQSRANGNDRAHGGRAAESRGRKNAEHQAAVRAWKGEHPDPATFEREILPGLCRVPIADLVAATGLSGHYCSLIRLGKKVPHPRHWDALRTAAER